MVIPSKACSYTDALSKALVNLNITDLEQLGNISQEALLKEMLVEYIAVNYDLRFAEKIGKDRTPADAHRVLKNDPSAVFGSIYRYKNIDSNEIKRLIKCTGQLAADDVENFAHVYTQTMEDLIELFSKDSKTKEYIGL